MAVTNGKASSAGTKAVVRKTPSVAASAKPVAAKVAAASVAAAAPVKESPAKPAAVAAAPVKASAPVKPIAAKPVSKTVPAKKPIAAKPAPTAPVAAKPVAAPAVPAVSKAAASPAPKTTPVAPVAKVASVMAEKVQQAHAKVASPLYRMENAMQLTKEQIEKASSTFFKSYEDLAVLGKGNVEAVVKSSTIFARGFEEMGRHIMALAQANMEHGVATAKAAMNCTTLKQIVELQNDFAKTAFDKAMAEGNKLSELSVKVANEAIEPIQARVNLTVETLVKPIAA